MQFEQYSAEPLLYFSTQGIDNDPLTNKLSIELLKVCKKRGDIILEKGFMYHLI